MIINDFPPEILTEIFNFATSEYRYPDTGRDAGKLHIMRPTSAPFNLVHVCRYWRAVALSVQSLWSSFLVDNFSPVATQHWLRFSETAKLNLALTRYQKGYRTPEVATMDPATLDAAKRMLQVFAAYSERLESLSFNSGYPNFTEEIINMLRSSAPRSSLEKLEIRLCWFHTSQTIIDNLVSAIASFKSLRHFVWKLRSEDIYIPRTALWHTLEVVHLEGPFEMEEAVWCLSHCTSATNVILLGGYGAIKRRAPGTTICTLPKLTSLTINEFCMPHLFFQYFTLPSLTNLKILTLKGSSTALQDFFVRSQCPLRKFHVYDEVGSMTNEDIANSIYIQYLRSVPEVLITIIMHPKKRFREIVQAWPNILQDLPGVGIRIDGIHRSIGWKKDTYVEGQQESLFWVYC